MSRTLTQLRNIMHVTSDFLNVYANMEEGEDKFRIKMAFGRTNNVSFHKLGIVSDELFDLSRYKGRSLKLRIALADLVNGASMAISEDPAWAYLHGRITDKEWTDVFSPLPKPESMAEYVFRH